MSKYVYNLLPDRNDERDEKYLFKNIFQTLDSIPDEEDLFSKLPPIWNQGNLGACQSFAIDSIVSSMHQNSFEPSHLFEYYNARFVMSEDDGQDYINEDSGTDLRSACKAMAKFGVCPSSDWEYDIEKFPIKPPQKAYDDAVVNKIVSYHRITSIDEMKQAIAQGFFVYAGVKVHESFESAECMRTGIVPSPSGKLLGGHAIVFGAYKNNVPKLGVLKSFLYKFIGKETSKGNLKFRNSWGDKVGQKGNFIISYENFEQIVMDMWVIVK